MRSPNVDVNVVPMSKVIHDLLVRLAIGSSQVIQRGVGENDTPAQRIVWPVSLENGNVVADSPALAESRSQDRMVPRQ